jgi:hypothetical protein
MVQALYLGTREHLSKTGCFATVVVERIFDGLALLSMALFAVLFVLNLAVIKGLSADVGVSSLTFGLFLIVPFIGGLALLLVVANNSPALQRWLASAPLPESLRRHGNSFLSGLAVLREPFPLILVYIFSVLLWLSYASLYLILAYAFGLQEVFPYFPELLAAAVLATAMSNLATAIPSTQSSIGPFDFFAQSTMVVLGVPAGVASAYAILVHAVIAIPVTLAGLTYLWFINLSLGSLRRAAEDYPA